MKSSGFFILCNDFILYALFMHYILINVFYRFPIFSLRNYFMSVFTKAKFKIVNAYYRVKDKTRDIYDNIVLKVKYSPFLSRLFSKLNNKTLFILAATYIIFIIIQVILFSSLWKAPDVSDVPEVKNYLSSYVFKYENINQKVESRLNNYIIELESFAKEYSVPFHLSWIFELQKKLSKRIKKYAGIKSLFIFNHLGRLLNFAPAREKFRNTNYKYTPYLKEVYKFYPKNKSAMIYFYTDSEIIHEKYEFKKGTHIERGRHYICEPFYVKTLLKKANKRTRPSPGDIDSLFTEQEYTPDHVPYLMLFTPLFNQLNRFIGVAGFNVDIDILFKDLLRENNKLFYTLVVNDKGIIVYSLNKKLIGSYVFHDEEIKSLFKNGRDIIVRDKSVFLKHKIKQKDWYVISKINPAEPLFSYKPYPYHTLMVIIFFLVEAAVFAALFLLFKKHISQPIASFSIGLKNLIKGNSLARVSLNHNDEFRLIEDRFNTLADRVKGYLIFGKTISNELVDEYLEHNYTGEMPTEEKIGTVMYLRIKNCEKLKNKIGKEDFDILMNKFLNDIEIHVSQYKGFIDTFSSDAVLAIFGIPINGSNHSQNAYECAKKIFKNLKKFNRINKSALRVSISINTGNIFYSQMRSNYGKLLVSLGDTIRNAYYYESVTNPFVLALSETTIDKMSAKPRVKKILHLKIKDMEEEVKIYLQSNR